MNEFLRRLMNGNTPRKDGAGAPGSDGLREENTEATPDTRLDPPRDGDGRCPGVPDTCGHGGVSDEYQLDETVEVDSGEGDNNDNGWDDSVLSPAPGESTEEFLSRMRSRLEAIHDSDGVGGQGKRKRNRKVQPVSTMSPKEIMAPGNPVRTGDGGGVYTWSNPTRNEDEGEITAGRENPDILVGMDKGGCSVVAIGEGKDIVTNEPTIVEHTIRKSSVKVATGWLPNFTWAPDETFMYGSEYETLYKVEPGICGSCEALIARMGGKSQLKTWLVSRFPRNVQTYVEPFFGSGKVFFSKPFRNRIEIVNDIDTDVIHFYRYARHAPDELINFINSMPTHEAIILGMRRELAEGKLTGIERAAAFYMCSSTAFNAMISSGLGRYASSPHALISTSIDKRRVDAVAKRLLGVDIRCTSYDRVLESSVKAVPGGLFVYLDPPYDQTAGYSGLGSEHAFGWQDHVKLAEFCDRINRLGGKFVQTNSSTDRLKELYASYGFEITVRKVMYTVAGKADSRGETDEIIISNFSLEETKKQRGLFS